MQVEELKKIITDQKEAFEEKMSSGSIIERDFLEQCKKYVARPNVFLLTGVRRCGKTVASYLLFKGNAFARINFDDERLYGLEAKELNKVLEAFYGLYGDVDNIILDEIQNVDGWELFANRMRENKKIIVTGSNASLLSKELGTRLTGRYVDFTAYPFSFREYLMYFNETPDIYSTKSIAQIKNRLQDYIKAGGFPESYAFGEKALISLYESILTKDIVLRYNIKYIKSLKDMSRLLVANFSSEMTFNKLKNVLGLKSAHTVKNYFEYFESAFLFFKLERFSFKLKEQIIAPKKIYVIDTGLINAVGFQVGKNDGRFIENIVAIELMRKKSENPLIDVFYWKDYKQNEVDFVIKGREKIMQLIQVCYNIDSYGAKERELKALLAASKEFRCKNLLVITWDFEAEEKFNGMRIIYIPLWKWLLQQ